MGAGQRPRRPTLASINVLRRLLPCRRRLKTWPERISDEERGLHDTTLPALVLDESSAPEAACRKRGMTASLCGYPELINFACLTPLVIGGGIHGGRNGPIICPGTHARQGTCSGLTPCCLYQPVPNLLNCDRSSPALRGNNVARPASQMVACGVQSPGSIMKTPAARGRARNVDE